MASAPNATDKKASLQKQIEALQKQMQDLDQEAVHELKLKLADARKLVATLEEELGRLTGRPNGAPKPRRARRESISDEALQTQLLSVMAKFGKEGLNAKQMGERLNQDALRVRKFINANPKVLKRQGTGPGTKFFLP